MGLTPTHKWAVGSPTVHSRFLAIDELVRSVEGAPHFQPSFGSEMVRMRRLHGRKRLSILTSMKGYLAVVVALGLAALLSGNPHEAVSLALADFTVPQNRRPLTCRSTGSPVVQEDENRMRGGLWASLPITSNPWVGNTPRVLAELASARRSTARTA